MSEHDKLDLALALSDKNRRPFKKNGNWVNLPALTPNGKIYVIEKASGTLIALDRQKDFKPALHKKWNPAEGTPKDRHHDQHSGGYLTEREAKEMQEARKAAELKARVDGPEEVEEAPEAVGEPVDEEVEAEGEDAAKKRHLELKEQWPSLTGDDRKEYLELNKVYGV